MARRKKLGRPPGKRNQSSASSNDNVVNLRSIAEELDLAIETLETRLRAIIKRVNTIMKVND